MRTIKKYLENWLLPMACCNYSLGFFSLQVLGFLEAFCDWKRGGVRMGSRCSVGPFELSVLESYN